MNENELNQRSKNERIVYFEEINSENGGIREAKM